MNNPLLGRMCVVYGHPDSHDPAAYLAEVAKMLAKYSADELERAGDLVIRSHRGRSFPTPSEIVSACEDARASMSPPRQHTSTFEDKYPEWSKQAYAIADRLTAGELGKRAAREGWILGLHEFCRKHRRHPSTAEVHTIQKDSEFVTRCAAGVIDMGYFHAPLQKLAVAMLKRREKLARKVLGEPAE